MWDSAKVSVTETGSRNQYRNVGRFLKAEDGFHLYEAPVCHCLYMNVCVSFLSVCVCVFDLCLCVIQYYIVVEILTIISSVLRQVKKFKIKCIVMYTDV
jgi:hypothetical protein